MLGSWGAGRSLEYGGHMAGNRSYICWLYFLVLAKDLAMWKCVLHPMRYGNYRNIYVFIRREPQKSLKILKSTGMCVEEYATNTLLHTSGQIFKTTAISVAPLYCVYNIRVYVGCIWLSGLKLIFLSCLLLRVLILGWLN